MLVKIFDGWVNPDKIVSLSPSGDDFTVITTDLKCITVKGNIDEIAKAINEQINNFGITNVQSSDVQLPDFQSGEMSWPKRKINA